MAAGASCSACGTTEKLKRCTSCKKVYYCGTKCQKQDLSRHRQEDGCGPALANGCKPCHQSTTSTTDSEKQQPRDAPYPPKASAANSSGPKCLRCGRLGEDIYADIVARSIFGSPDCKHGPYCTPCAQALQRLTLGFCSGCNALVRTMVFPDVQAEEQGEPQTEAVDIMGLD